jgi:DNA-binding transcriptional LysR family regulator
MKNATFRQWRVFSEVARHLSFVRAAQSLHLTPPAVTQQVKELEGHVGLPLFSRVGRQVQLTTAGEYMLVYARRLIGTVQEAEEAVARLTKSEAGSMTLGLVSTAKYFLPAFLAGFRQRYPGVEVTLQVGNRGQLVSWIKACDVDVAVMGKTPVDLVARSDAFALHPQVFVAPPDHPLLDEARDKPLSPQRLRGLPFILREGGSGTRAALERYCEANRVELKVVMEMPSNETIKQAVMAGLGLSFLSLHTVGLELDNDLLAVLPVEQAPVVRQWYVVQPGRKPLSPPAEAFKQFVLEHGQGLIAQRFGQFVQGQAEAAGDEPAATPS